MKYGNLVLTKRDFKLVNLILLNWRMSTELNMANYHLLTSELKNALVCDENSIPSDVVRFQSFVDIETPFGLLTNYELVVPIKRNPLQKKLSILSPIGSAIIGYAEGDEIKWNFPSGEQIIKILLVDNSNVSKNALQFK